MKNNFCVMLLSLMLCSCTTLKKVSSASSVSTSKVEQLKLGTSTNDVSQVLGTPGEELENQNNHTKNWLYFEPKTHYQSALLSFDSQSNNLIYKMVIPSEDEQENSLSYLLSVKYKNIQLQKIEYPNCGMDYSRAEAIYVNVENGIIIEYRKKFNTVNHISWSSPQDTQRQIDFILACRGSFWKKNNYPKLSEP